MKRIDTHRWSPKSTRHVSTGRLLGTNLAKGCFIDTPTDPHDTPMARIDTHFFFSFSKNLVAEKQKTKEKKVENEDQCGRIGGQLEGLKNRIHRNHFRKQSTSTSWGTASMLSARLLVLLGEKSHL